MNRTPMSQSYVNSQAGQQEGSGGQSEQQQQQQQQQGPAGQQSAQTMNMMIGSSGEQMSQMTSLLLEFAFSAFVNKPQDIIEYAAQYFEQLRNQRQGGAGTKRPSSESQRSNSSQNSLNNELLAHQTATNTSANTRASTSASNSRGQTSEPDEPAREVHEPPPPPSSSSRSVNFQAKEPPQAQPQPKTSYNRRKSVFAEAYDPAADQEEDENNRIVHGKTDEQRRRLARAIESIFLFRSVDAQDMRQILDAMFEVKVAPGDLVIRQGDDGDNFYVVERGKFQIYYTTEEGQRQVRGEYEDSGFFGELALMYNQPRAACVLALSAGSLWAMDRRTFRRIVLKGAFKKRKEYEALFEKVGVLQCLNGYERMNLCDALESRRFLNGQMIIVQGDQANGMYFIESGNVKIVKQLEDGRVIDVAILGKGDYFGELALINQKPRAASVYAMGDDVKLAFLDVEAFERLLGSCIERMEKNCALYLSELAHHESQNV